MIAILLAATLVLTLFNRAYSEAHLLYHRVAVANNSDKEIVFDLGDSGPPDAWVAIPRRTVRVAFTATNLRPGDRIRFWDSGRTQVTEVRQLSQTYAKTHFRGGTLVLEYPLGSEIKDY